ncbi:hypothetical protein D3C81_1119240 [compost metagenome]
MPWCAVILLLFQARERRLRSTSLRTAANEGAAAKAWSTRGTSSSMLSGKYPQSLRG